MNANILTEVTYWCFAVALSSTNTQYSSYSFANNDLLPVELQTKADECWSAEPHVYLHTKTLFTAVIPLT